MALSRWSHSDHYIYEIGENENGEEELQVSLFGRYTAKEILNDYSKIEAKANEDGCGFFSRLELKIYLTSWAKFQVDELDRISFTNRLVWLRRYGATKRYLRDPWDYDLNSLLMFHFRRIYWFMNGFSDKRRVKRERKTSSK